MKNSYSLIEKKGYTNIILKENSNLDYLGLDRILLDPGERIEHEFKDVESVFVLQNGDFKASVENQGKKVLKDITGSRSNVFDESPEVIYIPPYSKISIETVQGLEALIYNSPSTKNNSAIHLKSADINESIRGVLN